MKRFLSLILLVLAAAFASVPPATAEPSYPKGSRVGLEVPKGLTPSTNVPGFEDAERKVAITILDLPGNAFGEVEHAIFSQTKSQPGVSEEKRESFAFRSGIGFLISFRLEAEGTVFRKWVLLAGSPSGVAGDVTAVVSAQVPEAARDAYPEAVMRAALASVTFRPPPIEEQLSQVPFKLGDLAGFRIVRVMPMGGVILTEGPDDNNTEQPNIIVSVQPGGPTEMSERASFAEQVLSATPIPDMRVTNSEAIRIKGQAAYEVRAEGKTGRGTPLAIVQWLRFGSTGFMRILAVAQKSQWDTMFPRFRAIRDGIETR